MMKPTHFPAYMRFALLLAMLCSFATATAFDFEVDGIYYNRTSLTTVEVTYKDNNYGSYSGEVIIPNTVTVRVAQNYQATYTVTAIGDSAFYKSGVSSVTIPESVLSIGEAAFYECWLNDIICLSSIPPSFNNSFDYDKYAFFYPDIYEGWDNYYYRVLYVPEDAYALYYDSPLSYFFNYVLVIGAELEQTSSPSLSIVVNGFDVSLQINAEEGSAVYVRYYAMSASGMSSHESWWEECSDNYYYEYDFYRYYITFYAFAISDGKLPSDVVCIQSDLINPYVSDTVPTFDEVVDGVCYNFDSSSASIWRKP